MTINDIISERLLLMGTSQAQIAKEIGTNPTQMGAFLKGQGTLSSDVLERCFQLLGIDMSIYVERIIKAQEVADIIIEKGFTQIDNLTKMDFIYFTKIKSLKYLIDVSTVDEYKDILHGRLIDIESTFPYFKALVAYIVNIRKDRMRRTYGRSSNKITSSIAKVSLWGLFSPQKIQETEIDESEDSMYKLQRGSMFLFNKYSYESLNEKAIEYIMDGKI